MVGGSPRTLAIDPTSKGFAFAVLEGGEILIDWGLVRARGQAKYLARVQRLLSRYSPELLVLEDGRSSRRGVRARRLDRKVAEFAKEHGIEVAKVSRGRVRRMFEVSGTTKYEIARAISRFFPELAPRLPRKRRLWESEDLRMNIFDATSFALTVLREREWDRKA